MLEHVHECLRMSKGVQSVCSVLQIFSACLKHVNACLDMPKHVSIMHAWVVSVSLLNKAKKGGKASSFCIVTIWDFSEIIIFHKISFSTHAPTQHNFKR